ncbi:hypothetical protein TRFO_09875 [Tritrichomonas foetus]|uniref:Importin N-terminal domain-containing protein n=1 Tax=Tritrichomonas foetus TaxID=1144522 RepID=A0A1J4JFT2_9EUKA|nr:hypothetical protein TRFO_09875 [Tritrichomonas foetus]|eukprot:OHS96499.1 hypothetical protein TRFO_09875 [Tritrichomonas foetus]
MMNNKNYESLLNTEIPINLDLLDDCVQKMYLSGNQECHEICNRFHSRPDSLSIVDQVLQSNHSFHLKIFSLNIFAHFVESRWEALPEDNQVQLRNFIAQFINNVAAAPENSISPQNREHLLRYSNNVLINILKYDWPTKWPRFIPDILDATSSSPAMCANCFVILQNLAQEFTEFPEDSLSTSKTAEMSATFIEQFPMIFSLIEIALKSTENPDLVKACLKSLKYFIKAIDPTIIFSNAIFDTICSNLLPDPRYTIYCIAVFGEIAANPYLPNDVSTIILQLFGSIVQCLSNVFNPDDIYETNSRTGEQDFVHIFTVSMTSFVSSFQDILETPSNAPSYSIMLKWLFNVTAQAKNDDTDFKLCIDLWHTIARTIFTECASLRAEYSPVYIPLLPMLRRLAIQRMECPSELIYFFDETGVHSRRNESTTLSNVVFTAMREMLVYLTHIDRADMMAALLEKVDEIKRGNWSSEAMNCLCWAAGSIGGALTEDEEKHFVAQILEYLLTLCKELPDISMRANVASGIMYICSQYGRFLSKYWELLKVVMHKLFEFMSESIPEVQDSAIESMKSVVKYCRNLLVTRQANEESSFLEWMLANSSQVFAPLRPDNIVEMYEIYSTMIQLIHIDDDRNRMTSIISQNLNQRLTALTGNIQPMDQSWYEQLIFVINCNSKMATYLGPSFYSQLSQIIPQLVQIYTTISAGSQQVSPETREFIILQEIKGNIIKLFITSVQLCGRIGLISSTVLPPTLEVFMPDYQSTVAKTPEILGLLAALSTKLPGEIQNNIQHVFTAIYTPTLPFLQDYSECFKFWENFTMFIAALISHVPVFLTLISNNDVTVFMDYLKRCCSHPQQEVSEHALVALMDLLSALDTRVSQQFANEFTDFFGLDLVQFVMTLLTDSVHKYAFNTLMGISRKLIQLNTIRKKTDELFQIFLTLFPNRSPKELGEALQQMQEHSANYQEFKKILRNFMIQVRKFALHDPAIYKKEKEEILAVLAEKVKIPGLIPPNELPEVKEQVQKLCDVVNSFNL